MQEPIKASSASTSSATATGIVAPTSPAGVSLPGFKTGGDRDENGDGQFLFRRLAADAVAAASAATLVTPSKCPPFNVLKQRTNIVNSCDDNRQVGSSPESLVVGWWG